MMPLSTEPKTFGQKRGIIDWERENQKYLRQRLAKAEAEKIPSYREELSKLMCSLMPRYKKERYWVGRITVRNQQFKKWVRQQVEYQKWRSDFFARYAITENIPKEEAKA